MPALVQDVRYALRFLLKAPGFTFPALLTLALGVGANTAMLSVVNAVMLRPLPGIAAPDRLLWIGAVDRRSGHERMLQASEVDAVAALGVFEGLAASVPLSLNFAGRGEPQRISAALVNASYFATLGVKPAIGRLTGADPDRAILSWDFWQRYFESDPAIVGRPVLLNGQSFIVAGVTPRGFIGTELADHPPMLWALVTPGRSSALDPAGDVRFYLAGRLRSGVTLPQAQAALALLAARLQPAPSTRDADTNFRLAPLTGGVRPADRGDALSVALIGFAVVGAVLLIACANVAGLLLARASRREREMGMRIALGAGRWRLVRQLLTESALLASAAAVGGLLVAWWGTGALVSALAIPLPLDVRPDATVLAGTLAASAIAVLAFGMVPALYASRPDVAAAIAGATVAGTPRRRARLQRRFVITQIALSLVLLATAAMLLRHLHDATAADTRMGDADRLLVASFDLAGQGYSPERQRAFGRELLGRLEDVPAVESASIASLVPLGGARIGTHVQLAGAGDAARRTAYCNWVWPGYFRTVGARLARGRDFAEADNEGAAPVAIVNETMSRQFWPGEDAIGKRFRMGRADVTVVGLSADTPYDAVGDRAAPFVFFPSAQESVRRMPTGLVVRATHDASDLLPIVRGVVAQMDPALPLFDARTIQSVVRERRAPQRAASLVLDLFGLLALLLTTTGVYGVMAYAVERRTREIGVRVALGARAIDVMGLMMREGASLAGAGVAAGVLAAVAATRALAAVAELEPASPALLAAVSSLVALAILAACSIPARRAMRVDPAVTLRSL